MSEAVTIYTDGACSGNPGPGGWGAILIHRGREKELSILQAEYERVLAGGGQHVIIKGEPGIGKTQLARHFGNWARAGAAAFIYARFFDYEGSRLAAYETIIDLLSAALTPDRQAEAGGAVMIFAALKNLL